MSFARTVEVDVVRRSGGGAFSNGEPVSVVLPTHNRVDCLERAIGSVLQQTAGDLELIVVDDASTDTTLDLLDRLAGDDRLRVIELDEQVGASAARNAGLDAARHSLVAFQDSDDVWAPHKLETQLAVRSRASAEGWQVGVLGCGHTDIASLPCEATSEPVAWLVRTAPEWLAFGGAGTPKLLVDRAVCGDGRFDPELRTFEENDYVYSLLRGGEAVAILVQADLLGVDRGRADHVTTGRHERAALDYLQVKWGDDLDRMPDVRGWYRYRALRAAVRAGDRRDSLRRIRAGHLPPRPAGMAEIALGFVGGERGLAAATRLGVKPSRPPRAEPVAG